jgi:photosystem II stability/assembly factor-like uncharacterized protein
MVISPDFGRDDTLFVGTETGIFRSTNGGRAWRETPFDMDDAPVLSLALSPAYAADGVLFAGTDARGLFRSADRGQRWERIGVNAISDTVNAIVVSPEYPTKPHLLVMLNDTLLVSRDAGASWAPWCDDGRLAAGAISLLAPAGIDPGAPLLVSLADGRVIAL